MNTRLQKLIFLLFPAFSGGWAFAQNISPNTGNSKTQQPQICALTVEVTLCPNQTFTIGEDIYGAPATVTDTLFSGNGNCDTIVTYHLTPAPFIHAVKTVGFCPGESAVIDGITFNEPGTYVSNIPAPASGGGCDTLFTYHFINFPAPVRSDTIVLKPGVAVVIGGVSYTAPNFATDIAPAATGCDTLVNYVLLLDSTFPDTCSKTFTFLKVLGQSGISERSSVICAAADGNLYIAGEREKKSLLLKVTPEGKVLWARNFQPVAALTTRITDLIEDSDGMLAGCGIVHPDTSSPEAYAFRYNPLTGNMIWSKYLKQSKPEAFAIVERSPGGNFLLLISPQLVANVDDAQIWELNRNNGTLASTVKQYAFGNSDVWNSMVLHDGSIYVAGRHIPGPISVPAQLNRILTGVSKINLNSSEPVWSRLGHLNPAALTTLYGTDLIFHDNSLLVVSAGSDSLSVSSKSAFFLQKMTADGDLLWLKKYSVPGIQQVEAHDIQRISGGYLLSGQANFGGDWDKIVVKTDVDGNVVWAKSITNSDVYAEAGGQFFVHNHQSVVVHNNFYLTGFTADAQPDILLLKMTADGEVSDSCGFVQSLSVLSQTILNPANESIQVTQAPFIVSSLNAPVTPASVGVPSAALCLRCCEPVSVDSTLAFCSGESVSIGGVEYTQAGTVTDTIPGTVGCDTILTYTLVVLPQPVLSTTIEFCKGDTVTIGGNNYTQPGTVIDTIPSTTGGCDTIATYVLAFVDPPVASLSIDCPDDIDIATNPGTGPVAVQYNLPEASGDCECPGVALQLTQGFPSGGLFPPGTTQVCYQAKDSCGNTAGCCFEVTIREEQPCEIKTIGCLKYELLSITRNAASLDLTYQIRVTNNCQNKLIYTAFQLPDGIVAVEPPDNSIYAAPSGRQYDVRNPNYSPFYSIRFKSQADSIFGGQSDIFEYTLPPQINPAFIHVTARLYPQTFYETYLNTVNCPVEIVPNRVGDRQNQGEGLLNKTPDLKVFPNPTAGALYANLSEFKGAQLKIRLFDSRGQHLQLSSMPAGDGPQRLAIPERLPAGLYFLEILTEQGLRQTARFEVQR